MTSYKLRVATADESGAVEAVATGIRNATGLPARPVFQEIDRRELIVELTLLSTESPSPLELARCVRASSETLEVLGSWHDLEARTGHAAPPLRRLHFSGDVTLPAVARRAFDDGVPTAGWQPRAGSDNAHWLLAVPVVGGDGRLFAAVARRDGHYHRFSSRDATALGEAAAA